MRILLSISLTAAVLLASISSFAEDELKPLRDYNRLTKEMRRVPRDERAAETKRRALEYLEAWKATGRTATGSARYALAQFQQDAELFKEAAAGYRAARTDGKAKPKTCDYAATAEASLLTFAVLRDEVGMAAIDEATQDLVVYAGKMNEPDRARSRGKLYGVLAILHTMAGRNKESRALRMKMIAEDSKALGKQVRPIMRGMLGETYKMDAYDALRKEAAAVHKTITDTQSGVVAAAKAKLGGARSKLLSESPGALDGAGNLKQTDRKKMSNAERAYSGAKRSFDTATKLLGTLPAYAESFELLGKPAAAWTLEKAYSEEVSSLEDVKGKVVLLDFWNTWGPKCSFPVVRDLLREYGEKGLAVVGVTAGSNIVYSARYEFDEDFQSQADGESKYVARLASEKRPANGTYILEEGRYREVEVEAIGDFIHNHELKWPNVLIDRNEPGPKFAQDTWPHTVLLDKQGNIRFVRGGALARDNKVVVAKLKQVIEDLLAE